MSTARPFGIHQVWTSPSSSIMIELTLMVTELNNRGAIYLFRFHQQSRVFQCMVCTLLMLKICDIKIWNYLCSRRSAGFRMVGSRIPSSIYCHESDPGPWIESSAVPSLARELVDQQSRCGNTCSAKNKNIEIKRISA